MENTDIKRKRISTALFLSAEAILYILIMTTGGDALAYCSYASIVLCLLYVAVNFKESDRLVIGGLACTAAADFFLVICSPRQQLWGMVCFLITQTLYAIKLHSLGRNKTILIIRALLTVSVTAAAFIVLRENTDALAIISVCYYANLIVNIAEAFTLFKRNRLFAIGLVLFILCDTVVGLQAASGVYLPINEGTLLYRIIFVDFNLSWFFYLPSQVLISLSAGRWKDEK